MNRKEFLKGTSVFALFAVALSPFRWMGTAFAANFKKPAPAGKNIADPAKGMAKNMKYVNFAAEYAGPKKEQFQKQNAKCSNCSQFKPKAGEKEWGPCAILASAYVYEDGLCQMYLKKPGA